MSGFNGFVKSKNNMNQVNLVLDGVACKAPLRHGLIVQKMMEGLLKSGETGREVHIKVD